MELIHVIRWETGNLIRALRTDNGGEYCYNEFEAWLIRKGIQHETSAPQTPQQDGVSEKGIRTIAEGANSSLLIAALSVAGCPYENGRHTQPIADRTLEASSFQTAMQQPSAAQRKTSGKLP